MSAPPPYPATLLAEYDRLTDKKYAQGLSAREAERLQVLKEQMDALDAENSVVQEGLRRVDQTHEGVAALDQEIKELIESRRERPAG